MNYLFICAIGPVQDFIATARRSRDLWYGSWMLSELSKAAAKKISEISPQALIFPAPEDSKLLVPESNLNVPNRILAIVETDPKEVGEQIHQAIMSRLDVLRKEAFQNIRGPYKKELANKQVDDLPEYYWVGVPLEAEGQYTRARDQAEALMAARKATREFEQMEGDFEPKSSLDGSRESVIPESAYPQNTDNEIDTAEKTRKLYQNYGARQGERLSGVDLFKRLGEKSRAPKFKSTSDIAAIPFLESLEDKDRRLLLTEIHQLFQKENWDIGEADEGALLYQSRLSEWVPAPYREVLSKELEALLEKYARKRRPNPYYALLAADGDNMGMVIDAQQDPEQHRKLSNVLSQFALEVHQTIEKHQGVPIYSGGDDILAYIPLHTALPCIAELDQAFKERLKAFKGHDKDGREVFPTLSIGLVIAHHLTPLSDVLEMVRNAEKEAKGVEGKNGLAITISKRGGVERTIRGKLDDLSERMDRLIDFLKRDAISTGTAYELQELHRVLAPSAIPVDGLAGEALRIIARKHESGGGQTIASDVKDAFTDWIERARIPVGELAREMIVAQMFAGDGEVADNLAQKKAEVTS